MYALAAVLDPDLLHRLARATYAEMRLAGIDAVGEFHYVHHQADGIPYDDANAMGEALIAAARTSACGSACSTPATPGPRASSDVSTTATPMPGLPGRTTSRRAMPATPTW